MNKIQIPFHLMIPLLFSLVILVLLFISRKRLFATGTYKLLWFCAVLFFIIYAIIVGTSSYYDMYYQWNLNQYDLDGDGMFGGNESSAAQQTAMDKLTNDTGRNFSVITGGIAAGFVAALTFVSVKIYKRLKQ